MQEDPDEDMIAYHPLCYLSPEDLPPIPTILFTLSSFTLGEQKRKSEASTGSPAFDIWIQSGLGSTRSTPDINGNRDMPVSTVQGGFSTTYLLLTTRSSTLWQESAWLLTPD